MKINWHSNAVRSLKHILAPIFTFLVALAIVYVASAWTLPEKLLPYETMFLIFTAVFSLFFVAITVPCVVYSCYLAIMAIIRDKKYLLPTISLILNDCVLLAWIYIMRYFF